LFWRSLRRSPDVRASGISRRKGTLGIMSSGVLGFLIRFSPRRSTSRDHGDRAIGGIRSSRRRTERSGVISGTIRWRAWSAVRRPTCWRVREGDGSTTASSWKCRRRTSCSATILARFRIDPATAETFVSTGPARLRRVQAKVSARAVR
jgi:hypothetical protein